ncbi:MULTISPECIES: phage tail protein [unclassified Cyanobium]|uniref:phage tail protein n=1 Tax=unclassified Cyanobium TaxID=2627006 RepID=UPI0020CF0BC2|nr:MULTISPECIES: phage tail protein [unclassified Cyanobium]MCP9835693.1 phage tail protein [Cyanobium sp. La Preciosa 7G6]MCP9938482.1 phage tail protein [Cyanobium sp. Aljojuca 7A6]
MDRKDPYRNFRFLLEIDGITQAGFSDCTGFGSNLEVIEYREGGDAPTVRKLPGKATYPDITLKWGITDSRELYDWHRAALDGRIIRKDGSVILLDDVGEEKVRWNFFTAWPSKYDAPDLTAKGNDVAIETLTISCERTVRA